MTDYDDEKEGSYDSSDESSSESEDAPIYGINGFDSSDEEYQEDDEYLNDFQNDEEDNY